MTQICTITTRHCLANLHISGSRTFTGGCSPTIKATVCCCSPKTVFVNAAQISEELPSYRLSCVGSNRKAASSGTPTTAQDSDCSWLGSSLGHAFLLKEYPAVAIQMCTLVPSTYPTYSHWSQLTTPFQVVYGGEDSVYISYTVEVCQPPISKLDLYVSHRRASLFSRTRP